ncbi:potassium transporter Kef [Zobellella denitrificans]|uniref:Potassium transporter Kef n=1 Tax=Zobellella denitrificans TaxID=347534 RepID=A0A291HP39_9GAMM|nr:cation:proton antiporter family protein [Zobellella denitrificans]ATG73904.1 potassium transporter Kef [Zobellella denitrificans]
MDPIFIAIAFGCGLAVYLIKLPPLIGFLAAGFVLNAMGYASNDTLDTLANLGVTLLLFSIGLKLDIKTLLKKEVWGTASGHILFSTLLFTGVLLLVKWVGFSLAMELEWRQAVLMGFALSFSSTVFAVKVLEERSDMNTFYGRIAIGVLVMQDLFAVAFLTASAGKIPSPWALSLLVLLPLLRPLFYRILERAGHGELQTLFAVFLALVVGVGGFELVGLKGDLGALVIGMMLAPHYSASSLAKSFFNMKELFLVAFFLSIGLNGMPTTDALWIAAILLLALPAKSLLYYLLYARCGLRMRTSLLATFSLTNYSEFGLIVAALAAKQGLLSNDWVIVASIALAISFVAAAPLNSHNENIYRRLLARFRPKEKRRLHPDDMPIELGDARVLIVGMGRIGQGAYMELENHYRGRLLGIDSDEKKVELLQKLNINAIKGDASDSDFWDKTNINGQLDYIFLAMPNHAGNLYALEQIHQADFKGRVAAIIRYPEEGAQLRDMGADEVFDIYEEAGSGFARHVIEHAG